MKPISIFMFILGIMVVGGFWLAMKPAYDVIVTDGFSGLTGITSAESAYFKIFPFLIGGLILVWLVIKLTRRGGGQQPPGIGGPF